MRIAPSSVADVTRPVELVPECICRNTTLLAKINEDGSIDVFFGPNEPEQKGNWIKTVPGKARSQSSASTVPQNHSSTRAGC
ncbi:MAG: DUF1214 domain-containing protein [Methyloceanibacter sp.]